MLDLIPAYHCDSSISDGRLTGSARPSRCSSSSTDMTLRRRPSRSNDQDAFQEVITVGGADVIMDLWQSEYESGYGVAKRREDIGDRGRLYDDGRAGWFVPAYVVDTHPDTASIETLANAARVFGATFISCPTAWPCDTFNNVKLDAYGLSGNFQVETPVTVADLAQRPKTAFENHEAVIAYYHEPSPPLFCYVRTGYVLQSLVGTGSVEYA